MDGLCRSWPLGSYVGGDGIGVELEVPRSVVVDEHIYIREQSFLYVVRDSRLVLRRTC